MKSTWMYRNYSPLRQFYSSSIKPQNTPTAQKSIQGRPIEEIPGPKPKPIILNSLDIFLRKDFNLNKQHELFENLTKEYGPIFKLEVIGIPPMIMTTNPDDCEAFHRANLNDPRRTAFLSLRKLRHEDPYFEKKGGLLAENGDEWWRVRKRTQTPILGSGAVVRFLPQLDQVVLDFMNIISTHQRQNGEMPEDFLKDLYRFALEAVSLVALDKRLGCLDLQVIEKDSKQMKMIDSANDFLEMLGKLEYGFPFWRMLPTPSYRKMQKAHTVFKDHVVKEIEDTQKRLEGQTFKEGQALPILAAFLKTPGLEINDITTTILDLILAGIDTTSHTLAFTLYLLARNPDKQRKLQEEVDNALGDGSETFDEEHLSKIPYLRACIREALRLYPIVFGTARILNDDLILSGYRVPKGCQVISLNYQMGRDEKIFGKPLEFIPERWGKDRPLGQIHPFAWLPFNFGRRMCIGRRVAEQEMFCFLARAMHRFNVEYKYKDIQFVTKFVGTPSEPLKFEFHERR